jgi:hypothetical protein
LLGVLRVENPEIVEMLEAEGVTNDVLLKNELIEVEAIGSLELLGMLTVESTIGAVVDVVLP